MQINKDRNLVNYNFVIANKKVEPVTFYFVEWNKRVELLIGFLKRKAFKRSEIELLREVGIYGFENNFAIFTKEEFEEIEKSTIEILKKQEKEKKEQAKLIKETRKFEPEKIEPEKQKRKRYYKKKKKDKE